ncbi:hypothetical protein [Paenibacillus sp. FSL R5-0912]
MELGRKGIKLPDDLSVIGYDDAFLPHIRSAAYHHTSPVGRNWNACR